MDSLRSSMQPGQGGGPDEMAAALAEALGLSESEVAAALEANRPDGGGMGGAPPAAAPDGSRRRTAVRTSATPSTGDRVAAVSS